MRLKKFVKLKIYTKPNISFIYAKYKKNTISIVLNFQFLKILI